MPGETGAEASSQTSKVVAHVERERMAETMRLLREAAERARAKASDATISGAPIGIAKRASGENRDPFPIRSSEAIAKHGADERTTARWPEPIATQPAPIQNTLTRETSSPVDPSNWSVEQPSSATAALAAQAHSALMELERRAPEPVTSVPAKKIEQRIADWCIAVGTALRGPWPDAVWDFYERMTDVATWWRFIKLVLKYLARFIPGRDPEPSRVSKAIREGFRFLHEPPTPWPPKWQPKKPEDPRAAQGAVSGSRHDDQRGKPVAADSENSSEEP